LNVIATAEEMQGGGGGVIMKNLCNQVLQANVTQYRVLEELIFEAQSE